MTNLVYNQSTETYHRLLEIMNNLLATGVVRLTEVPSATLEDLGLLWHHKMSLRNTKSFETLVEEAVELITSKLLGDFLNNDAIRSKFFKRAAPGIVRGKENTGVSIQVFTLYYRTTLEEFGGRKECTAVSAELGVELVFTDTSKGIFIKVLAYGTTEKHNLGHQLLLNSGLVLLPLERIILTKSGFFSSDVQSNSSCIVCRHEVLEYVSSCLNGYLVDQNNYFYDKQLAKDLVRKIIKNFQSRENGWAQVGTTPDSYPLFVRITLPGGEGDDKEKDFEKRKGDLDVNVVNQDDLTLYIKSPEVQVEFSFDDNPTSPQRKNVSYVENQRHMRINAGLLYYSRVFNVYANLLVSQQ